MKYYSEELKQFFDTEEQCLAKEEEARQKKESAKATKAKYAKAVEDAENALDEAYKQLKEAKTKVEQLQKEYDEKVDNIMNPAQELVKQCTKARYEAIQDFTKNYGTYTTTYSGNKADEELFKTLDKFTNIFNNRFWF